MVYVYILFNLEAKKLYIGFTNDIKRRIEEHKRGKVETTKYWENIDLIFYEAFKTEKDARRREKYFKSTKGKRAIKIMLAEYFKKHAN